MKNILLFFIIFYCYTGVFAQYDNAGTTAYPALNVKYDARSIAMAGASVAMPNEVYGTFSNPSAIISDTDKVEVFLGYNSIIDGVWGIPVAVSKSFPKYGVFAINLYSVTSGKISVTDENNRSTGETAQWTFLTGGVSWGYRLNDNLTIGASVKGIYDQVVEYSSNGVAVDLGMQYRMNSNRLIFGLVLKNAGLMINSYTSESKRNYLPMTIEAGVSVIPKSIPQVRFAFDINKSIDDYVNFEPAVEINIYKKILTGRLGYAFSEKDVRNVINTLQGDEDENYVKSNMSSLCVGAGIKTNVKNNNLKLDFGMQFNSFSTIPSFLVSAMIDIL